MPHKKSRTTPCTAQTVRMLFASAVIVTFCSTATSQTPPPPPAPPPVPALASGGASYLYVSEQPSGYNQPGTILQLRADASGKVTPSRSLELSPTSGVLAFTVDDSGKIYAALPAYFEKSGNEQQLLRSTEIEVYAANASGKTAPLRTFSGGMLNEPRGIAVARSGEVYVADASGTVYVFSNNSDGLSTPARAINGPLTHLDAGIGGVAVDSAGFLYVAAGKSILVFSPDADKNTAPVRTISSTYNGCNVSFRQLGLDDRENLYASAVNNATTSGPNPCTGIPPIFVFGRGADGDSTPLKALSPAPDKKHPQGNVYSFAVDRAGNLFTAGAGGNEILGYGPGADRDALPASEITLQGVSQKTVAVLAVQ